MIFLFIIYVIVFVQFNSACQDDFIESRRVKRPESMDSILPKILIPHYPYPANNIGNPESRLFSSYFLASLANFNPFPTNPIQCTGSSGGNGYCTSAFQCSAAGGIPSGFCFFGVCCLSSITQCGGVVTRNNSYWQSPTNLVTDQPCTLTIRLNSNSLQQKNSPICQVRLDFESFSIAQPSQVTSVCSTDTFQVTGTSNSVPVICGDNTGQHMYLNPPSSTSDITLTFSFGNTADTRSWRMKIALLPCGATYLAPPDCLQYFQGTNMGTIQSFNYKTIPASSTIRQIGNQDYGICLRREQGKCSICYSQCTTPTSATPAPFPFSISGDASVTTAASAAGSANCTADYLIIASGYDPTTPTNTNDRFCGTALNAATTPATSAKQVCTTIKPFNVWYHTDAMEPSTGTSLDKGNLGFCLTYTQQSC